MNGRALLAGALAVLCVGGAAVAPVVARADVPSEPVTGGFVSVAPTRVVDTRSGLGLPRRQVAAGAAVSFDVTAPARGAAVSAAEVNVTATGGPTRGFLTVYPAGQARPGTSTLNYRPDRAVANAALVVVRNGKVAVYNSGPGPVDVIVDVSGYHLGGGSRALTGAVVGVAPQRLLDTREIGNGRVASGQAVRIFLQDVPIVPQTGVAGLVLNVTATGSNGGGSLSVDPTHQTSILNYTAGADVAGLTFAAVQGDHVDVANNGPAAVQIVVDLEGYVVGAQNPNTTDTTTAPGGVVVRTVDPATAEVQTPLRVLDTRTGVGTTRAGSLPAGGAVAFRPTGNDLVPSGVAAVIVTLTATGGSRSGFLSVRAGVGQPGATSTVNYLGGTDVANAAVVPVDASGVAQVFNGGGGTVNVVVDVVGYVQGPSTAAARQIRQSTATDIAVENPSQFSQGAVYVSAQSAGDVDVYNLEGQYVSRMTGFRTPEGLAVHDNTLYVADPGYGEIFKDGQPFARVPGVRRLAWAGDQLWATSGISVNTSGSQFKLWHVDASGAATPYGNGFYFGDDVVASPSDPSVLYVADTTGSSSGGSVVRYDVSTGTPVRTTTSPGFNDLRQIASSPDGRLLTVANGVSVIDLDAVTLQPVTTHAGTERPAGIAWSPDGNLVAVAQGARFASQLDQIAPDAVIRPAGNDTPLVSIGGANLPAGVPHGVAFSVDGTRLFVVTIANQTPLPKYQLSSYDLTPPTS